MLARACMLAGLALAVSGLSPAQAGDAQRGGAVGVIDLEPGENTITVTGRVVALVEGHYDAAMSVKRSGKSGNTNSTQKGAFDLAPGESADVARMGISYAPGDDLSVGLTISRNGVAIWRTTASAAGE